MSGPCMAAEQNGDTIKMTTAAGDMPADDMFMDAALSLAAEARGATPPNPMVGCVIVKDGEIVGRGRHNGPGLAHAEVDALQDAGSAAKGATAYVTLEPCNHTGRTGPCVDALISAGVAEVVYALADPNPIAAGGAQRLAQAGVRVRAGVKEAEARALNRGWLHVVRYNRPFVIGKVAMSLDGRIATHAGKSKWLTGPMTRRRGHELRAACDAIMVGAGTVLADDPTLTARLDGATTAPLRIVADSTGRTPPGAKAFERSGKGAVLAATHALQHDRQRAYEDIGVRILKSDPDDDGRIDVADMLHRLTELNIQTLMIEGGGKLLGSFFDADMLDEIHLFYAPLLIGGGRSGLDGIGVETIADASGFEFTTPEMIGRDLYLRGVRRREAS